MARDPSTLGEPDSPLLNPWGVLAVGLAAEAVAWLWSLALGDVFPAVRGILLAAGLLAVGSAVALRLQRAGWETDDRITSTALLALAALGCGLAWLGLDPAWDSLGILVRVLALAAAGGAFLVALPWRARLVAISLLVVFHFGAILTAVAMVPPPSTSPPWLAAQLWTRVYRPYLEITNLNNGYHFYAPEPGPMTLLWFRLEYADGTSHWVRLPNHKTSRNQLETRRAGALAVSLSQSNGVDPQAFPQLAEQHRLAGERHNPPIPTAPLPLERQYRPLTLQGKMLLASYVRRVARTTPPSEGGEQEVKAIKAYLVDYNNAPVAHFQAGGDPFDPTLYAPYYLGEFDAQGQLTASAAQDPLLYWMIPIMRVPEGQPGQPGEPPASTGTRVMNYLRIHAGDGNEEGVP
jgi:hypothetical protein